MIACAIDLSVVESDYLGDGVVPVFDRRCLPVILEMADLASAAYDSSFKDDIPEQSKFECIVLDDRDQRPHGCTSFR